MNKRIKKKKSSNRKRELQIATFYSSRAVASLFDYEYEHNTLKNQKEFHFKIVPYRRTFRTVNNRIISRVRIGFEMEENVNENHLSVLRWQNF